MTRTCIVAVLLWTVACSQEAPIAEPAPAAAPTPEPVAAVEPAPLAPAPEPDPTPDEVPIAQDFEDEVAAQITTKNFRGELKKLEVEIAKDSAE